MIKNYNFVYFSTPITSYFNSNLSKNASRLTGGLTGAIIGGTSGAIYNPTIINEETGQTSKIGLLGRAGLVWGGASLGGIGGRVIGGAGDTITKGIDSASNKLKLEKLKNDTSL